MLIGSVTVTVTVIVSVLTWGGEADGDELVELILGVWRAPGGAPTQPLGDGRGEIRGNRVRGWVERVG